VGPKPRPVQDNLTQVDRFDRLKPRAAMLRYHTLPVTPFQQNCSLVWCDETNEAALIDPGGEVERLTAEVARRGLKLVALWLTHAHIDHAGGTGQLARGWPANIGPHPGDQF
jgi:glyoxylase-like metal-dependent hydrolase (beta-lactamase superfamily II)